MCGFAGEFFWGGPQARLDAARTMAATLAHRGPNEAGEYLAPDGRCAIGFRRLCVIDPPLSHQPMTSADGRCTVAFNGEIYNFRALREELAAQGTVFATQGDTEVLLHLYRLHGRAMLDKLHGMFAFALYDSREETLLLARDRLGQKPLWYAAIPGGIAFASEAKALLAHPQVSRQMDPQAVLFYLSLGYIPAPLSIWRDLRKMPPASAALVHNALPQPTSYWQPKAIQESATTDISASYIRSALTEAVRNHMISDVPLGALLSGGIDSSIIVAIMSRLAGKPGDVRTFTAGFDIKGFDERPAARAVAAHCQTQHTELLVEPLSETMLDQIVTMYDEPFGDSSALPTWLICRQAAKHITVALTGDGGDEVFGGYDRYRAINMAQECSAGTFLALRLVAMIIRPFTPLNSRNRARRFLRMADAMPYPYATQYFMYMSLFGASDLSRLLTPDFAKDQNLFQAEDWFTELYEQQENDSEMAQAQCHDMLAYLPYDLLVKSDIASMASGLELRSPMLDDSVVPLGLSLPTEKKISARHGKMILREAFADLLPPSVFERPKRGFAIPLSHWLRNDLCQMMRQTLMDKGIERYGILNRQALSGLVNDHIEKRDDHSQRLWALLVFVRWLASQ